MAVIITIRIEELSDVMSTSVNGSIEGASPAEVAHGAELGRALKSIINDMSRPTAGCDCPACQLNRGAGDEFKNLH